MSIKMHVPTRNIHAQLKQLCFLAIGLAAILFAFYATAAVADAQSQNGKIIIRKEINPGNSNQHPGFDFTTGGLHPEQLWLMGGEEHVFHNVAPGVYSFREYFIPNGWRLVDITCDDRDGNTTVDLSIQTVHVSIDNGETVRCIFWNEKIPSPGRIIVPEDTAYCFTIINRNIDRLGR